MLAFVWSAFRLYTVTPLPAILIPMKVQGLQYLEDFIDDATQEMLLQSIEHEPWRDDLQRRVQHYGYRYDYKARQIDRSMFLGQLPSWVLSVGDSLVKKGIFAKTPDQLIVNEYQPGQGISAHIDCVPCFGPVVASLSLLSSCLIEFISKESGEVVPLWLAPRSLLVLSEEARYRWQHRIPARKTDVINAVPHKRGRRISLTFRTIQLKS
jgi:alkylated DNA repair dioxygenase AlkB